MSAPSPGKLVMIAASGCGSNGLGGGGGELVGVGAGGVELAQQGEGLPADGVLDQRGLVQVLGAQHLLESVGFGVDAALAAGAAQQRAQLGLGQLAPRGGVGAAASMARASGRSRPPRLSANAWRKAG